jgi:hypothetical protein
MPISVRVRPPTRASPGVLVWRAVLADEGAIPAQMLRKVAYLPVLASAAEVAGTAGRKFSRIQ